jgi:hypothetical protein
MSTEPQRGQKRPRGSRRGGNGSDSDSGNGGIKGKENPYPPDGPPQWFRVWWPVISTVVAFIFGGALLFFDSRDGTVAAPLLAAYLLLMGYLPLAVLTGLFKK